MRIIGGFLRGKKISFLKSKNTRPLKDLVKESIFNVIIHSKLININLEKSEVLDLYSGTGSFGIECISRGAKNVDFVENDRDAIFTLQNNLNKFKINENGKLYGDKINIFLQTFAKKKYNLFFLDPPFKENSYGQDLENIFKLKLFKKDHLIIIHRDKKTKDKLKEFVKILLEKQYGRSKIIFASFF